MLQTEPFAGRLTTEVAGGDSLRYYPAFDLPGRARLAPQAPVTAATAALLLVQRLDGSLTIGDTHSYDEPFDFDLDEAPSTICWRGPSGCSARRCRPPLSLGRGLPPGQRHRRAVPPIAGRARRHSGDWGRRTGDDLLTRDRRGNVRDRHLRTL
jgi:hypothetical protein